MPIDQLTQNFLDQLEDRDEVSKATSSPQINLASPQSSLEELWKSAAEGQYPDWYERSRKENPESGVLNAVGVGLWSLVDTGLFGVPGALVQEEEFLDFEDPLAKWTGAIGGFGGFVAGAPMKIGAKVTQKLAAKVIPKVVKGTQGIDPILKTMRKAGKDGGLSDRAVRKVTKGYENLVRKSDTDEVIREKFANKVSDYVNQYVGNGVRTGAIKSSQEAEAIRSMFTKEVFRRPLQDFKSLALAKYGNTKYAKWLGHAINDVVMFSFIDTVFESVSTIEDGHFDFTAPLWGSINGLAFSSLSLLKPAGKSSKWFSDFKPAVRAAFGKKSPYSKMSDLQLASSMKFMGESQIRSGKKTAEANILYKGKNHIFRLDDLGVNANPEQAANKLLLRAKSKFGDDYKKAMISWLEPQRKEWGKELIRLATKQEAANFAQVWPRMLLGGLLFNAHSFYNMFAHDEEMGVDDILPHFLIGAFIQRHNNASKFDLNRYSHDIKLARENLTYLRYRPDQISFIPSLQLPENEWTNPFHREKYRKVIEKAEEEGIISDDYEITTRPIERGSQSIAVPENRNIEFEEIYKLLNGRRASMRSLDDISKESAKRVVDVFKEVSPDINLKQDHLVEKWKEEESQAMTKGFEDNFQGIISSLKDLVYVHPRTGQETPLITTEQKNRKLRVPELVDISPSLRDKAREGKLPWLNGLKGEEAVRELESKFDSFGSVKDVAHTLQQVRFNSKEQGQYVEINSEVSAEKIYNVISSEEASINNLFRNKSSHISDFSFSNNLNDYVHILARNKAIRNTRDIIEIFSPEYSNRDNLRAYLSGAGILQRETGTSRSLLVEDIRQIKIDGADGEKAAELTRFLGRVHSLQKIAGKYQRTLNDVRVNASDIERLQAKLVEFGYNEAEIPPWLSKHIVHYAIRQSFKDAPELSVQDFHSLFNLSALKFASFGVEVSGKKGAGASVKLIDETFSQNTQYANIREDVVREYNSRVMEIVDRSNGLIMPIKEKAIVTDQAHLSQLIEALPKGAVDSSESAASKIGLFLDTISSSEIKGSAKFRDQAGKLIEDLGPEGVQKLTRWLTESNVLIPSERKSSQWDLDIKAYNEEIVKVIGKKISRHGITPEYAERAYVSREREARDRHMIDTGELELGSVRNITLQEFYEKYRPDGSDLSRVDIETQKDNIDSLIFEDKKGRLLKKDSVLRVLNRLHVLTKNEGKREWKQFGLLPAKQRDNRRKEVVRDLVGLFGSRQAQVSVEKMSLDRGRISVKKEHVQYNRYEALMDKLGISPIIIDPLASVHFLSKDGRRPERKIIDIFGDTNNLTEYNRKQIRKARNDFEAHAAKAWEIDGKSITGLFDNEFGFAPMRLSPNMSPIAIRLGDFKKIHEPFKLFAEEVLDKKFGLTDENVIKSIKQLKKSLETADKSNSLAVNVDYEDALRYMMIKDFLTGSDGNKLFLRALNGNINPKSLDKLLGRVKLYNTKKFVRIDKDFAGDVADAYAAIGDVETNRVIKNRLKDDGWGVSIWNDGESANLMREVDRMIRDLKIDWNRSDTIGDAHMDVSSFDSIAFVSRDSMRFYHAMAGHNPNSFNPMKPVISSGGENSPLLLGKTLFVYSPNLDPFFKKNGKVDILLTSTAAKALNPVAGEGVSDVSLINEVPWSKLPDVRVNSNQIRKLSLDSIGLKPEKDLPMRNAKDSKADQNYFNNEESKRAFADIEKPLNTSILNAKKITSDPIKLRSMILRQLGDDALAPMIEGSEAVAHMDGMFYYAGLTKDANPMDYSEGMAKNKIWNTYIDPIINKQRSVTNQFDVDNSIRYGGQSTLIQAPIGTFNGETWNDGRLKGTFVDKNGNMKSRGEVLLGIHEAESKLSELISKGMELRFVDNSKVYTGLELFTELYGKDYKNVKALKPKQIKESWEALLDADADLGTVHTFIEQAGKEFNKPNLQVGILVRRNPRTRPNDMALMGLKGFLPKEYGNSMMINSFDVVNIFEGDYDADRADYYFANRKNTYDHVNRVSPYFVQGIDPTRWMEPSGFSFGLSSSMKHDKIEEMSANLDLFKRSIGIVQKVPPKLKYLSNIGNPISQTDPSMNHLIRKNHKGKDVSPKVLFQGSDYKIIMDYEHADFFTRAALETQYIIDGSNNINKRIANDIYSWQDNFLFPNWDKSITPGEMQTQPNGGIGFVNELISNGGRSSANKRVRIFRKVEREGDSYVEKGGLSNLDKAIIKEMLSEYGKLLDVTGNTFYERSGEAKNVSFDKIMDASERYFKFNSDLRKSLYYRLRNRNIDSANPKKGKWWQDNDFKKLFGVVTHPAKQVRGQWKKAWYSSENNKMFPDDVTQKAEGITKGEVGSSMERILQKVYDANLFEETRSDLLVGDYKAQMDSWYNEMISDPTASPTSKNDRSDRFTEQIIGGVFDINRKVALISSLRKKIFQIKRNKYQSWKVKNESIEKVEKIIDEVSGEIKEWLPEKDKKGFTKDELKYIKFVEVDTPNMKKGTIYFATIDQMKRFLPLVGGSDNFGLGSDARNHLKRTKNIRKIFYSNQDSLGEILEHGGKTLERSGASEYLRNLPSMSQHYDIENRLLMDGVQKYGLKYLWAFMQPAHNKYNVGVFNGKPISVPFEASEGYNPSSRYRRGLQFLVALAKGEREMGEYKPDGVSSDVAKRALRILQVTQAQYERYFNSRFDLKGLQADNLADVVMVDNKQWLYNAIRLPNYYKGLERNLLPFGSIKWDRTSERARNGFGMLNDHLIDFYREILRSSGKEREFDTYLESMHEIQNMMMGNNTINPLEYMSLRNGLDKDVKDIAEKTLTRAVMDSKGSPVETNRLIGNPVWAIMGGNAHWKGLSRGTNLEKSSKYSMKGLEDMMNIQKTIEKVKNEMPVDESGESKFKRLEDELYEIKKCL